MRLITDNQVEALIRMNRLRATDHRLTRYTQEQAEESVAALEELLHHRGVVQVEGVIRDGKVEAC